MRLRRLLILPRCCTFEWAYLRCLSIYLMSNRKSVVCRFRCMGISRKSNPSKTISRFYPSKVKCYCCKYILTSMQRSTRSSKVKQMPSCSEEESEYEAKVVPEVKPKEPVTLNKVLVRSATAAALSLFYLGLLQTGHLYCILSIVFIQTQLYREIVNVRYVAAKEREMPWFRSLQWAWFLIAMVYVYGETMHKFCTEHRSLNHFTSITSNLNTLVYGLYWITFIASVLTLKPGMFRFQLSQHMWSIVTVCIVVFQSWFLATVTLHGIFWFFFPFATVTMNDVSAYFAGITFGRKFITTPFLALSPNKTWEGFIGAGIMTIIFSFFFPALLAQFTWFTCPADGLYIWPLPGPLTCTPNPVFIKTLINLPIVGPTLLYPMQLHGLAYGLFASIVAPFGGFFASAIKRAYHKKDFDSFIPGHGGMMDRMDCQLLMTTFNAFYYFSFIAITSHTVDKMLYYTSQMSPEDQYVLWQEVVCCFIALIAYMIVVD